MQQLRQTRPAARPPGSSFHAKNSFQPGAESRVEHGRRGRAERVDGRPDLADVRRAPVAAAQMLVDRGVDRRHKRAVDVVGDELDQAMALTDAAQAAQKSRPRRAARRVYRRHPDHPNPRPSCGRMSDPARELPLRVGIDDGEALDSWLLRLARRNKMPASWLMPVLGLSDLPARERVLARPVAHRRVPLTRFTAQAVTFSGPPGS